MKTYFTYILIALMLGFSSAGFAKEACANNGLPNEADKPTQLFQGHKANCTCKFPTDCDVPICQQLKQYQKKCDVSPYSMKPDFFYDPLLRLVDLQTLD